VEGKEAQEREIERLAEIRAKKRLDSWSERFKSIWYILFVLLVVLGFFTLLIVWIVDLSGGINTRVELPGGNNISLAWFITFVIFILGWVFYDQNKTWKKARLREFYEEELLELKMKSKGELEGRSPSQKYFPFPLIRGRG